MQHNQDVHRSLIHAVRNGRLGKVRELIDTYGLLYSRSWAKGYVLLRDAVAKGHTEVAKLLLTRDSRVNSKTGMPSDTPLHFAAANGDIEIVQMLIDKGASINFRNQDGRTPLLNAIESRKIEVTELLLKYRADVYATDQHGRSLLHTAVTMECLQIVEHLLNYGVDVNYVCFDTFRKGYTALHFAVECSNKEIITLLLSRGANVDAKEENSLTPLHIAAKKGNVHIVDNLLNHGANAQSTTCEGYTPLHFASKLDNEEIVKLLLNGGADVRLLLQNKTKVDNQDKDGKNILQLAVEKESLVIVEDVLKYCPDINNQSNRSAFRIAVLGCGEKYKKIVIALQEYGFTVDPEDAKNPKLLHNFVEKGLVKIVEDLLKYGADINMLQSLKYGDFSTPLHVAVKNKQEGAVKLLIRYKADINAQDKTGKTPIFYAIKNDDLNITQLLLTNRANIKDDPELLNIAVKESYVKIVEALLQHDVDINANFGLQNITPLHISAETGNIIISTMLLNKGANVNAKQKGGTTALHIAAQKGHEEVLEVLLEWGAEVDSKSEFVNTPLNVAVLNGHRKIIETILKFGADINSRDRFGRTALHVASEVNEEIVATLLDNGSDINITGDSNRTAFNQALCWIKYFWDQFDEFDHYLDPNSVSCKYEPIAKVLERHIVKMKTANFYVSEKNLLAMRNRHVRDDFQDECEIEIASMKSKKINNTNISYYDILSKATSALAICMKNKNVVLALEEGSYKRDFPIYAGMIEYYFKNCMERKSYLNQAVKSPICSSKTFLSYRMNVRTKYLLTLITKN